MLPSKACSSVPEIFFYPDGAAAEHAAHGRRHKDGFVVLLVIRGCDIHGDGGSRGGAREGLGPAACGGAAQPASSAQTVATRQAGSTGESLASRRDVRTRSADIFQFLLTAFGPFG